MPSGQYSYIDIAALDPVRRRFAAGDAMAILTPGLDEVIWANGPGAALFGFSDIESIIGAEPQMGFAAKRQIMATSAYPKIGKDRAVTVRLASGMTSRAVAFIASEIVLPDGEDAILLAVPAAAGAGRSPAEMAARAIAGLDQAGQYAAIVDAAGGVVAASPGFGELRITTDTLAAMVAEADGDRLVKRMIPAAAALLPAGFLRLIDDPATHLLAVIDEVLPEHDENEHAGNEHDAAPDEQAEAAAAEEVAVAPAEVAAEPAKSAGEAAMPADLKAEDAVEAAVSASADAAQTAALDAAAAGATMPARHDDWYFAERTDAQDEAAPSEPVEPSIAPVTDEPHDNAVVQAEEAGRPEMEPASGSDAIPEAADSAAPRIDVDRSAAPVRFAWKTDADGRFNVISDDFAAAVGLPAADLIGRSFKEVAQSLGLDRDGEIAGLLERRDTWSGRSVLWPVAGTDLRIPVDLAALPVYDRARNFSGFRGFGVARAGDAIVDPEAAGLDLGEGQARGRRFTVKRCRYARHQCRQRRHANRGSVQGRSAGPVDRAEAGAALFRQGHPPGGAPPAEWREGSVAG